MKKNFVKAAASVLCLVMMLSLFAVASFAAPSAESDSYVLMDALTGQALYGKNMDKHVDPMFVSRVLTTLLAAEQADPEKSVTVTENAVKLEKNASNIGLKAGERVRYIDLMYAAMLYSAEDAANAIGYAMGGTAEAFAQQLNERAAAAGASDTNVGNAGGAIESGTYTTALDTAKIVADAIKNETFCEIYSSTSYDIQPDNVRDTVYHISASDFSMTNKEKPYYYAGALGGAVGYVKNYGCSGFAVAEKNGTTLIAVVFGAKNIAERYSSLKVLLDYGFNDFVRKDIVFPSRSVPVVENGLVVAAAGIYAENKTYLLHKDISDSYVTMSVSVAETYSRYNISPSVTLSLPDSVTQMYPDIGTFGLDFSLTNIENPYPYVPQQKPTEPGGEDDPGTNRGMSPWIKIPLIILLVTAGFCIVMIALLVAVNMHRRKMQREKRMRKRAAQTRRTSVNTKK
ncbi:MAG: D-alanyl-D-alanine carboxypeptidase family protein [Eubacteriales bacterium]